MIKDAMWITPECDFGDICPVFTKEFEISENIDNAFLSVSATGVYEAFIDGARVGDFILAPGFTTYSKRLQYQTYNITNMLKKGKHTIKITVGKGWYMSRMTKDIHYKTSVTPSVIAELEIVSGSKATGIKTDTSWQATESNILFSDIYDGEIYDAAFCGKTVGVKNAKANKSVLIPTEGEVVKEQERFLPFKKFTTPNGEYVIDFGQEITGYVEVSLIAHKGDKVSLSFAEVLDSNGNFYNENYRSAKCKYEYICCEGEQSYKPHTTFYGFRYIRVNEAPDNAQFTAISVFSDIKQTIFASTQHKGLNKLFNNALCGQKYNFLDIPTDCPQRDERQGWTGDAQVFAKTAAYQFDVKRFFTKWLNDMACEQRFDGLIPNTIPWVWGGADNINGEPNASAAWGDASVICPWVLYEMYGDKELLKKHFPMMQKWILYIENTTDDKYLWTGHNSFGDWLALDAEPGSYTGSTNKDFISSAYYKYSLGIVAKAARALGHDYKAYEDKMNMARSAFINRFNTFNTQTECVLALYFDLTNQKEQTAKKLAQMIQKNGNCLTTGFVGTPYILFALSENGYTELAYTLLLQDKFPSWLYSVNKGATTIWEHWDGIKDDGSFWSEDMNSFNHYAYGSVMEWVYSVAAGIRVNENGFSVCPIPDKRLGNLDVKFNSRYGEFYSHWKYDGDILNYKIKIPVSCPVTVNGKCEVLDAGEYNYSIKINK